MFINACLKLLEVVVILSALFAVGLSNANNNDENESGLTHTYVIDLADLIKGTNAIESSATLYNNVTTNSLAAIVTNLTTLNSTYDHDYGSCTRFNYFTIESITPISITINGTDAWFWSTFAKKGNYSENVISFVAFMDKNNRSLIIDSQWIKDNYYPIDRKYDYILNYRIMAISADDAKELVKKTLYTLERSWKVSFANTIEPSSPTIFIKNVEYLNDNITLNINSTENTTVQFCSDLRYLNKQKGLAAVNIHKCINSTIVRGTNTKNLPAKGVVDGIIFLITSKFMDKVFIANGFWYAFADKESNVTKTDINCPELVNNRTSKGLTIPGCVRMTGAIGSRGYVGCGYSFNPIRGSIDISQYQALSFFAKGNEEQYTVKIETSSVTDYNYYQYKFIAPTKGRQFIIPLSIFKQQHWGKRVKLTGNDVKNVVWIYENNSDHTKQDLFIGNVSFIMLP